MKLSGRYWNLFFQEKVNFEDENSQNLIRIKKLQNSPNRAHAQKRGLTAKRDVPRVAWEERQGRWADEAGHEAGWQRQGRWSEEAEHEAGWQRQPLVARATVSRTKVCGRRAPAVERPGRDPQPTLRIQY